jgi:hypothetical protein
MSDVILRCQSLQQVHVSECSQQVQFCAAGAFLCKDVMYICLSSCTHAKCVVVFCDVAYQPLVNYLPSSKGYVLLRLLENY